MRAWPDLDLPVLPGRGIVPRLYDSSAGALSEPVRGSRAGMYVCGITPYDATHLGHAATYLAFDVLTRVWRDAGLDVDVVQNVTDVDDPLLERAAATGRDWQELASEQTELFATDMTWLRVLAPQRYIGAVESIPLVIELIERLRDLSAVYEVDGDLYFSVRSDPRFGAVSGLDEATMRALFAERGGDPDRQSKKDALDPLVWRAARPGEPSWPSPFGPGRPGWHVECAAIALEYLDTPLQVQGGGSDLAFPHHEMSAAHAQVASGRWPFAECYVHAGMIGLDGEKMSKSRGNLVLVSQLRDAGHEAATVRLALLAGHYRSDRQWRPALLPAAGERLGRWRRAASATTGPDPRPLLARVREALANDLDTPAALAAMDAWAVAALGGAGQDSAGPAMFRTIADSLLGITV